MKWISVKDRLPENNDEVIVIINYNNVYYRPFTSVFLVDSGFTGSDASENITHWMPLPEPPNK